jgi:N,N-dimethylformamidase
MSVAPGERIQFMISAESAEYEAQVVRLRTPFQVAGGPEFKEKFVEAPVNGAHAGRKQIAHSGSYVLVPDDPRLRLTGSFTLQVWLFPTTPGKGVEQGLITKWAMETSAGYGLFLTEEGDLAFWLGDGNGKVRKVRTETPLLKARWYSVACTYNAEDGVVCLHQRPLYWEGDIGSGVAVEHDVKGLVPAENDAPLLIAAGYLESDVKGKRFAGAVFNGKVDNPRVVTGALDLRQMQNVRIEDHANADGKLLAAWDFSQEISSAKVVDTSLNDLHGTAFNMPTRAVTGYNWSGKHVNFNLAPQEYGAIHFHEDDIEDAGWEADLAFDVGEHFRSGVYGLRLRSDSQEDYIPFFARPKKGEPTAEVAFLAPTFTYMAYGNERLYWDRDYSAVTDHQLVITEADRYLAAHPEFGLSLYDFHSDGSGSCHSSRLRPIINMRPKYRTFLNAAARHFAADLYLVDWLEEKGFGHDILTDEDLHLEGEELFAPYKVIITGSHPEYWTEVMLGALEAYLGNGGRLMYLGGNGFYWVTAVDPERPHIIEVRRGVNGTRSWTSAPGESYLSTTGEPGGLWRYRGKAPQRFVGVGFTSQGWGGAEGYARRSDSFDERIAFIFEGIGDDEVIGDFGLVMGGAAGDEIDRLDYTLGTPPHALLLATSSLRHSDYYQYAVEDLLALVPDQGGTKNPGVRADMVFFETPNEGAVFSVGSINWCGSLPYNKYDNNVSRVTENVLRRFCS